MARILALDYGKKRTGIAVTDPLQIIASGLTTVDTIYNLSFLKDYIKKEEVEKIVIGYPFKMENTRTADSLPLIDGFIKKLKKSFPNIPIIKEDEHFTSKMAVQVMIDGGVKKKKRRDKALVDKISATLILKSYLDRK
ncbi:MAG: Holliday junction resolvase RuvX [Bacteroidetes bacterium]|nr:MAG: Holliday junction resolvase RuvX [Bacteroidota bacterium]